VIEVKGAGVPYAGSVPWSGAIVDASDARVLFIEANGDLIKTTKNVCGLPVERTRVAASPGQVVIQVDGYAKPITDPCAGVGHALQRLAVRLPSPLAGRTLIDATTRRHHRVLDPTTVPSVLGVPTNYAASPLTWNDRNSIATRYFTVDVNPSQIASQIGLDYALPASPAHLAPLAADTSRAVTIDGRPGVFYGFSEDVGRTHFNRWTILWTRADRSQLRLTVSGPSAVILSQQRALQLADSIR
jgi:hypothetical protein